MKAKIGNALLGFALVAALLMGVSGCSKSVSAQTDAALQEAAQAFVDEVSEDLLPYRARYDWLVEEGVAISTQDASYGIEAIEDFQKQRERGEDCQLTMFFYTSNQNIIAINRIGFRGGEGYLFRFQYNERSNEQVAVNIRRVDDVEITVDGMNDKAAVIPKNGKAEVASFRFNNVVWDRQSVQDNG